MQLLELFSGTHSIGKVGHQLGYEVTSVDRDLGPDCVLKSGYKSDKHIKTDIMTWNYREYPPGYFDVITASPVCLWWSVLRKSWIGRKCKKICPDGSVVTMEKLQNDIDKLGKPMVDKVFEIIEYFKPAYWWIENPQTSTMKDYIKSQYPQYNTYYDVDYCKYSNWGYKKTTRFWTNIKNFTPKKCKLDCDNIITIGKSKLHLFRLGISGENKKRLQHAIIINDVRIDRCDNKSRFERYRIPESLIFDLFYGMD